MTSLHKQLRSLKGLDAAIIVDKLLEAIDKGATTDEIRTDVKRYLTSGKKKEIIINTGGEGLKLSPALIEEMAKKGDQLAQKIIDQNRFIDYRFSEEKFAYLEDKHGNYDRSNPILISMLKEGKYENNGGMNLIVCEVYEEPWMYKICKADDHWGSEYIEGWYKVCN